MYTVSPRLYVDDIIQPEKICRRYCKIKMLLRTNEIFLVLIIPFTVAKIRNSYNNENDLVHETKRYKPEFDDLNSRPLPQRYDAAKIGIMLHWGVYSVPAYGPNSEFFWGLIHTKDRGSLMAKNYPGLTYQDLAAMFTAKAFDPDEWSSLFAKAGAKYVVLTTKHHEGYYLFPSAQNKWNSKNFGSHRDLVSDLSAGVTKKGLKFGVYYSMWQFYNSTYDDDRKTNFTRRVYPETITIPDIKQLMNDYKPSLLWVDGDFFECYTYWGALKTIARLYNDSPIRNEIVTNERWGKYDAKHCKGKAVDKMLGDFYNYKDDFETTSILPHKFETATRLDRNSWGYRTNYDENKDLWKYYDLLVHVVKTVSCGGNALINVGPTKEGTIDQVFKNRLLSLGAWLKINGEAIYDSSPWYKQNDSGNRDVWYTCTKSEYNATHPTAVPSYNDTITAIYAITLKWPKNGKLKMKDVASMMQVGEYSVRLLGNEDNIPYKVRNGVATFALPDQNTVKSKDAWTLEFTLRNIRFSTWQH